MAADRRAEPVHRAVDDRLAVDRIGDRLAHLQLVERLPLVVHGEDRLALGAADQHLEPRIALELAERLHIGETRERVDVAGEHRRDRRRGIGDEAECRMRDRDMRRVAIAVPFVEGDRRALRPGGELVRPGADRIGGLAGGALFVQDHRRIRAEMEQRLEARPLELEHDGQRVGRLDQFDRGEEGLVLVGGIPWRRSARRKI